METPINLSSGETAEVRGKEALPPTSGEKTQTVVRPVRFPKIWKRLVGSRIPNRYSLHAADGASQSRAGSSRNAALDVLRGIAILLVMGVHFNFSSPHATSVAFVANVWRTVGLVGVDLFFVLSGFLIGSLLLTEVERHSVLNVPRFLIRRGFKLYPVYYSFLAYTILMASAKSYGHTHELGPSLWIHVREFLPSLIFVQNYIHPNPAAHTWSLAIEEHFYILLPLLIVALGSNRVWKWLLPICLSAIPVCLGFRIVEILREQAQGTATSATHLNIGQSHFHFDALMLGVALAVIAIRHPVYFIKLARYPKTFVIAGLALWFISLVPMQWIFFWGTFGFTLRLLGSAMILLALCHQGPRMKRTALIAKASGLLAWIGANSYAIYVWHVTVMGSAEKAFVFRLGHVIPNDGLRWIVMATCLVVTAVLAGALVTRLVERPSLALRDRTFPSLGRAVVVPGSAVSSDIREAVAAGAVIAGRCSSHC